MDQKLPDTSGSNPGSPPAAPSAHLDKEKPWGKGFLAVCGSFIWPGIGHLIVGSWFAGLVWIVIFAVLGLAGFAALASTRWLVWVIPILAIETLLAVAQLIHAFLAGRRCSRRLGPVWFRYLAGIALLVLASRLNLCFRAAYYFRDHWVQTYVTPSRAMSPTLRPGDHFLLNKRLLPRRWSLVVVQYPGQEGVPYVSRLAGLPGERIEIVNGELTINGAVSSRPTDVGPYAEIPYRGDIDPALRDKRCAGCDGNPIVLGPDDYFVLCDNTAEARDSRLIEAPVSGHSLGALPSQYFQPGRITAIYWPPSRWRVFDR